MKKRLFLPSFICLLAVSCTVNELDMQVPTSTEDEKPVFYASLEPSEPDTKVVLNPDNKILWDVNDQISIFNKTTLNQQYGFTGTEPANSGSFQWVDNGFFGAGNDLDYICAVYPYQESTKISNSDVLTLTLPEEQTYREKSFGPGANTMVSITDVNRLRFKNVGGYLALKFYGDDVSVSSIRLIGNNGEPLSGKGTIQLPFDEVPEIEMASTAEKTIFLDCEKPVKLGTTSENATVFWMVVPPTDFEFGFTLLVTNPDGEVFIKKTDKHLTINRNGILRIAPIMVEMNSAELSIDEVESADQEKLPSTTDKDFENRTFTVTMPTLDRSHLVLDYDFTEGANLLANGLAIEPGVTPIDVTKPATLTVYKGDYGKNYTIVGKNTGLPIVRISTSGFSLDQLEDEKNAINSSDGKDHRTWHSKTSVRIENADGTPGMNQILDINQAKIPVYEIATQIKGRGNYTWIWDKKPYALKFNDAREVLGMPAHKRWVLLANWRDHTLLRNDATFELSRRAGLPYTVRGQFVELEFNGEYRGNYYLCEQIKIDNNRVNITPLEDDDFSDLSGGYLMEIDSYWDEINKFHSAHFNLNYMFKEPDEDPADEDFDSRFQNGYTWMENYINEFERVLKTKSTNANFTNYLNVDSAILFMLLNEMTGNRDFFQPSHTPTNDVYGPHSTYLYKDKGGKLIMGPGWDFDYETFIPARHYPNGRYKWRGFKETGYYYYFMCYNSDFVARIQQIWTNKKSLFLDITTDESGYIDIMTDYIRLSQKFDAKKWPYENGQENRNDNHDFYENGKYYSFQEAIDLMKSSFESRIDWMDGQIKNTNNLKTNPNYNEWLH